MKRIFSLMTAACMLCCSTITSFAATAASTTPVFCSSGSKGGILAVNINADIENLSGVHLTFKYDHSKLRFKDQETFLGHGDAVEDEETIEWSTMLDPKGQKITYDDTIATLNFDVISELEEDNTCIEIGVAEAYDSDMKDVDFKEKGVLDITYTGNYGKRGDFDGDDVITSSDALSILRTSLSDIDTLDNRTKTICDCNNDNAIDSADALETLRFSADLPTDSLVGGETTIQNRCIDLLKLF